jgi:hypothetical protein
MPSRIAGATHHPKAGSEAVNARSGLTAERGCYECTSLLYQRLEGETLPPYRQTSPGPAIPSASQTVIPKRQGLLERTQSASRIVAALGTQTRIGHRMRIGRGRKRYGIRHSTEYLVFQVLKHPSVYSPCCRSTHEPSLAEAHFDTRTVDTWQLQ